MNPIEKKERVKFLWDMVRTNYKRRIFLMTLAIMVEQKTAKGVDLVD